jgi:hypothetical protein
MSFISMAISYPFPLPGYEPPLSQVSSIEALRRHMMLAVERGLFPIAAEYRREITRRETNENRRAA